MRERTLLKGWRHGNPVAGHELIERHSRSLRRYLINIVGLAHADRLAKQVFDRGLAVARWEDPQTSFRDLLLVVCEDVVREHVRLRCEQKGVTLLAKARKGASSEWTEALSTLPLELSIVIELCVGHSVSVRLAASILEQSKDGVRRKLLQGRRLLTILVKEQRARQQAEQLRQERARADALFNRPRSEPSPAADAPQHAARVDTPAPHPAAPVEHRTPSEPRAGFQWWTPQVAVAGRAT